MLILGVKIAADEVQGGPTGPMRQRSDAGACENGMLG